MRRRANRFGPKGDKRILPSCLFQRWVHSREEDTADVEVYRPPSYSFPPSRGRKGFEIREDGRFVEMGIGPADGPDRTILRWEAPADDRLEVKGDDRAYVLELVSASENVLKARRHP